MNDIAVFSGRNNTHVYTVKAQQSYHENRIAFDFSISLSLGVFRFGLCDMD